MKNRTDEMGVQSHHHKGKLLTSSELDCCSVLFCVNEGTQQLSSTSVNGCRCDSHKTTLYLYIRPDGMLYLRRIEYDRRRRGAHYLIKADSSQVSVEFTVFSCPFDS